MEPNVFSEFYLPPPSSSIYLLRKTTTTCEKKPQIIIPTRSQKSSKFEDPEIPSSSVAAYKNKNDDILYL